MLIVMESSFLNVPNKYVHVINILIDDIQVAPIYSLSGCLAVCLQGLGHEELAEALGGELLDLVSVARNLS